MLNPCARESKARTGRFLGEKLMSDHGLFFFYEGQQGAANGQASWGVFQGCAGLCTAGCWLASWLRQLKTSTAMDLGISILLISACVALRNLGLLIKTVWSMIYLSASLLRTLASAGRGWATTIRLTVDRDCSRHGVRRFDGSF